MKKGVLAALFLLMIGGVLLWKSSLRESGVDSAQKGATTPEKRPVQHFVNNGREDASRQTKTSQKTIREGSCDLCQEGPHLSPVAPRHLTPQQWKRLQDQLVNRPFKENVVPAKKNSPLRYKVQNGTHHVSVARLKPDGRVEVTCHRTLAGVVKALEAPQKRKKGE